MKEIELSQGKVALVDDADFEEISKYRWYAGFKGGRFYAQRNLRLPDGKRITLQMHRVILVPDKGKMIDHKDGNGLNNQRDNIRTCTCQENQFNTSHRGGSSQYKGVTWEKRSRQWRALIVIEGKLTHIGFFANEVEAAHAYDRMACQFYGEFARPNFRVAP